MVQPLNTDSEPEKLPEESRARRRGQQRPGLGWQRREGAWMRGAGVEPAVRADAQMVHAQQASVAGA